MRTTLPTYPTPLPTPDGTRAWAPAQRPPAGARDRVTVEQRPQGGVVLRVRSILPPAPAAGYAALFVLVATFLLVAVGAVAIFSVTWVKQDFDVAAALDNLPRFAAGPPHLVLAVGSLLALLAAGAVATVWTLAYGLLLGTVRLEVTPDGWVIRSRGARELWRVQVARVEAVDYEPASCVLRTDDGRVRRVRGWDADMASLAVSLRWALAAVAAASTQPELAP